jgi:rhodanese-related sulfurtransferase
MRPLFGPRIERPGIPVIPHLIEFATRHWQLFWSTVVLAFAAIGFELWSRQHDLASVSPQDLVRLVNQNALVLDLRPAEQYKAGHVSGARHVSGEQIQKAGDAFKRHKEKVVVVYDDTGAQGHGAVRQLVAQGFKNAVSLRGGIAAWRSENLPLTRD